MSRLTPFELKIPDEIITGPIPETLDMTYEDLENERPSNVINHPSMDAQMAERLKAGNDALKRIQTQIGNQDIDAALDAGQDGDADLFIKRFKWHYVYDHAVGAWQYWNDHHWRDEKINQVTASIREVISSYEKERQRLVRLRETAMDQAAKVLDAKIGMIRKRIYQLHTTAYKQSVLKLAAAGVDSLGIPGDNWDSKPMLLGVRNGCVNLETGGFKPGEPKDFIKVVCQTPWEDINAVPTTWIKFIHEIFDGDQEIIDFIQRLLGYGITGKTTENIYPILWGEHGQNGKGTLIEMLREILGGQMAVKLSSEFLMARGFQKSSTSPDAELFSLRGARIAWCSETSKGERINVHRIKEISGSDTISARPPYGKEQIYFRPSHLIFILTNRRPQMPADDDALWFRTILIPFMFSFVPRPDPNKPWERLRDEELLAKLKKEAPAILAWLVRGCLEWQKHGLKTPEKLLAAAKEYRDSEDIFQDFLDENIYPEAGGFFERKSLFDRYKQWATDGEFKRMNIKHFYEELERKLGKHSQMYGNHGSRGYHGYSLLSGSYAV